LFCNAAMTRLQAFLSKEELPPQKRRKVSAIVFKKANIGYHRLVSPYEPLPEYDLGPDGKPKIPSVTVRPLNFIFSEFLL